MLTAAGNPIVCKLELSVEIAAGCTLYIQRVIGVLGNTYIYIYIYTTVTLLTPHNQWVVGVSGRIRRKSAKNLRWRVCKVSRCSGN